MPNSPSNSMANNCTSLLIVLIISILGESVYSQNDKFEMLKKMLENRGQQQPSRPSSPSSYSDDEVLKNPVATQHFWEFLRQYLHPLRRWEMTNIAQMININIDGDGLMALRFERIKHLLKVHKFMSESFIEGNDVSRRQEYYTRLRINAFGETYLMLNSLMKSTNAESTGFRLTTLGKDVFGCLEQLIRTNYPAGEQWVSILDRQNWKCQ